MIEIIVAITAGKGAIGRKGDMIYHISDDLRRFKALTTGHTVVMGRRTFDSLPKGALPNRRNIVISRNPEFRADNTEVARSLGEALEMANDDPKVFVIGGGQIYAEALPLADRLEITLIEAPEPEDADTFFPPIDPTEWKMTEMTESRPDSRTGIPHRFLTFERV